MRLFELLNVLNQDEQVTVYGKKTYRDTPNNLNKNSCKYLGNTVKHVGIRWFSTGSIDAFSIGTIDVNDIDAELSIEVEE